MAEERTRTLTNGFGDRHATITPILFQDLDELTSTSNFKLLT